MSVTPVPPMYSGHFSSCFCVSFLIQGFILAWLCQNMQPLLPSDVSYAAVMHDQALLTFAFSVYLMNYVVFCPSRDFVRSFTNVCQLK